MTAPTLSTKLNLEHLTTLYQISMTMNSSLKFDEALANVIDAMMLATKAERGVLMGFEEETGE